MQPFKHCFSCGSSDLTNFYEQANVPVNSCLMMSDRQDAIAYGRGDIRLAFCEACGFIQNVLFDGSRLEYSSRYEETQGFSGRFNQFANDLAARLVQSHDLHGKQILEIGCGKGEFLSQLCRLGNNEGLGIDPSYVEERLPADVAERLRFITDFYSEDYLQLGGDFIVCRHTLEHIQPVQDFVKLVRRSIGERREPIVFFEVPDVTRVLAELAFWDIYYEHCSYFSLGSLARLFRATDFSVCDLRTDYDDQYLLIEAVSSQGRGGRDRDCEDDMAHLRQLVSHFAKNQCAKKQEWAKSVKKVRAANGKTVLWGSSSKAVAYLTTLGINDDIEFVVDINPFRHGKFLAGSGHEIVAPEFLEEYKPDLVIAMNPIYKGEIQESLDSMGLKAELTAV